MDSSDAGTVPDRRSSGQGYPGLLRFVLPVDLIQKILDSQN